MIRYGFNSTFGIKALILIEPFHRSETINPKTGDVWPSKKVKTVSKHLADVIHNKKCRFIKGWRNQEENLKKLQIQVFVENHAAEFVT